MRPNIVGAAVCLAAPLILLAACSVNVGDDDGANDSASISVGEDGNVAITANDGDGRVSLSVPGFEAKVKIPGLELGGESMDIDGMKLYPGTKLSAINVTDSKGPNQGLVEMRFTSPSTPEKLAAYYADAARAEDFTDIDVAAQDGGTTFSAKKGDGDDVKIIMNPADGGTTAGQIVIRGKK